MQTHTNHHETRQTVTLLRAKAVRRDTAIERQDDLPLASYCTCPSEILQLPWDQRPHLLVCDDCDASAAWDEEHEPEWDEMYGEEVGTDWMEVK